jgi:hypothetical protein
MSSSSFRRAKTGCSGSKIADETDLLEADRSLMGRVVAWGADLGVANTTTLSDRDRVQITQP